MKRFYLVLTAVIACLFTCSNATASHIVGGEVTYIYQGNNQYRFELDIYEDCKDGQPQAIAEDNPAHYTIFTGTGAVYDSGATFFVQRTTVPTNFNNSCINNPPAVCLFKTTFIVTANLPANATGYYFFYGRCCRNDALINIRNPGNTGASYYCYVPKRDPVSTASNTSAVFKNYPPQIVCVNNPLVYDHSATDADGDSLSYSFSPALRSPESEAASNGGPPFPSPKHLIFIPVTYVTPFSAANPMGGFPQIQINPKTGLITGTPTRQGRFVVTVCCIEWRNGQRLDSVRRDFQFTVTNCSKAVVADIPQYSEEPNTYIVQCDSLNVHFVNLSTGGFSYHWDFGVPGQADDTSSQFEPDFLYPAPGIYTVTLLVNKGSTCPDSISRLVKVYPKFHTDFSIAGLHCPGSPITFTDLSTSTYQPINQFAWSFGDGTGTNTQNTTHTYSEGGTYTVQLVSQNIKGCIDTAVKTLDVERFRPFAGNDTIIVKGESINFHATGGTFYTWTPSTNLSDPFISNPIGYYPDTTRIGYNVHIKSEVGCEGDDSIYVRVVNQGAIFVPSGFTPNGDGLNDFLKVVSIGYRKINYFRVFNRWGEQVFYTVYINDGWDGTKRGKPADIGVYFWELAVTNRFGVEEKYKGDATLIR